VISRPLFRFSLGLSNWSWSWHRSHEILVSVSHVLVSWSQIICSSSVMTSHCVCWYSYLVIMNILLVKKSSSSSIICRLLFQICNI